MVKALGDRIAEALAEMMHKRARDAWGFGKNEGLAIEDLVLRGQIDLWFEEGGELILVDYKTDDVQARDSAARAQQGIHDRGGAILRSPSLWS